MFYDIFRIIGLILGYPIQLIFFKRRTFYENGVKRKVKKGGKLIISNHFNMFDYVMTSFIVFPRKDENIGRITDGWDYELTDMDFIDISSTEIRNGKNKSSIAEGYIKENGLYKT